MLRRGRSFSGRERNCAYLNLGNSKEGGPRYANISALSGFDFADDARALAIADWDHDGDLDVWVSNRNTPQLRFLRNDNTSGRHFLSLKLVGSGTTTNRDAIGARVEVVIAKPKSDIRHPKLIKTLRAGEGFLAQSSKWLHFGLEWPT